MPREPAWVGLDLTACKTHLCCATYTSEYQFLATDDRVSLMRAHIIHHAGASCNNVAIDVSLRTGLFGSAVCSLWQRCGRVERQHRMIQRIRTVGATLKSLISRDTPRTKRWFALEKIGRRAVRLSQFFFTILFVVLLGVAWSGQPTEAPSNICQVLWVAIAFKLITMATPTVKHAYLKPKTSPRATFSEALATIIMSVGCIGMAVFLYLYARGQSRIATVGSWDWQRAIMVWAYWVSSFFLMQVYGIVCGFALLVLTFTGCCFFGCCNICGRGPLFNWLRKVRRRRQPVVKKAGSIVSPKYAGGSNIESRVDASSICRLRDVDAVDVVSKEDAEPIIDFVENKAQISILTPVRLFPNAFSRLALSDSLASLARISLSAHLCLRICHRLHACHDGVGSHRTGRDAPYHSGGTICDARAVSVSDSHWPQVGGEREAEREDHLCWNTPVVELLARAPKRPLQGCDY